LFIKEEKKHLFDSILMALNEQVIQGLLTGVVGTKKMIQNLHGNNSHELPKQLLSRIILQIKSHSENLSTGGSRNSRTFYRRFLFFELDVTKNHNYWSFPRLFADEKWYKIVCSHPHRCLFHLHFLNLFLVFLIFCT